MKTFTVPVMKIGVVNKNMRVYPQSTVEAMLAKTVGKKYLCELNMPAPNQGIGGLAVNMENVSHVIESMFSIDDTVYAELRVLTTPKGIVLQQLLDAETDLQNADTAAQFVEHDGFAFRTAGYGNFEPQADGTILVTNFTLTGVHCVANPA